MSQFQAFCPTCHQVNVYGAMPHAGAAATCVSCGTQFIPNPGPLQQPAQQPLQPTGYADQWTQQSPPKKPGAGNNKKLIIGLAAGGGGLVLVLILVFVLFHGSGGTDDGAPVQTTTQNGQPAPLNQANLQQNTKPGVGYQWPTKTVECKFILQTQVANKILTIDGRTRYQGTSEDPSRLAKELEMEGEGSGTGFVVHPEGILVTCAHVVQGSTSIKARLGGSEYTAKVIALNEQDDLAILKIDAKDLPFLKLSDSSRLQLAEEVRVIGFPLSTTLGESIKVTRGSLAGFIERANGRILQLDASINPGNSGGPVVNASGQLVGVASAILVGEKVQKVGFGVPSQKVVALLRERKIPYVSDDEKAPLDGPALAKKVTPSVAFLKVEYGFGGVGIGKPKVVQYEGRYTVFQADARSPRARSSMGLPVRDNGKLLVGTDGKVLHDASRHDKELPLMMGMLGQVGIEALPPADKDEWEEVDITIVPQVETADPLAGSRYSPYRRRFGRYSQPIPKKVFVHPAITRTQYRVVSKTGDELKIEKKFALTTISREDGPPYLEVEGRGTYIFDRRQGVPKSMEFKGTYKQTKDGRTLTLPLKLNFEYGDAQLAVAPNKKTQPSTGNPFVAKKKESPVRKVSDTVQPARPSSSRTGDTSGLGKFDPTK